MEATLKPTDLALPDHFSYSQLSLYRDCPGAWKDAKILKVPQETSDPAIFGSTFHDLTAHYDLHCKSRKVQTDYGAEDTIFEAMMREHPEAEPQRQALKDLFSEYVQRTIVDFEHLLGVEMSMDMEIAGTRFTGTLDRLFLDEPGFGLAVRDHKTDGRIRTQDEVDKDFQLSIYAALAAKTVNWSGDVAVEMLFDRYGVLRKSVRTPEQIEATVADLERLIEDIAERFGTVSLGKLALDEAFPYTPGSRCSICGRRYDCPEIEKCSSFDPRPIVTEDDRDAALSAYITLTERLKGLTAALKDWCSEHGNTAVNGLDIGFHRTESYTYPLAQTVAVLEAVKIDPFVYLKTDTVKIKKLVKGDGELAEALKRIREDNSKTTFKAIKIKE